jgi:hypothetical protein
MAKRERGISRVVQVSKRSGVLTPIEPHPAYITALEYLRSTPYDEMAVILESMASCAIEGNRLGEVCAETWRRLQAGEPVSDRYLMGLAWAVWGARNDFQHP